MRKPTSDTDREKQPNLEALRAELDAYIGSRSLTPQVLRQYESQWRKWEEHCAALPGNPDPLGAPFAAYVALLGRDDVTPKQVWRWTAAIRYFHERAGLTPAYLATQNRERWLTLTRGLRRRHGAQSSPQNPTRAKPMLREHARQMIEATPETTARQRAHRAMILSHLDLQISVAQLSRWTVPESQPQGRTGPLAIGEVEIPCDHRERVRGVPWDCTACAIRDLIRHASTPGALLFEPLGVTPHQIAKIFGQAFRRTAYQRLAHVVERHPDHRSIPRIRATASPYEVAGMRRALVLLLGYESGFALVRARAWLATAWVNGLRMASDFSDISRRDVSEDALGRGFAITLGSTKTDRSAARRKTVTVTWASSGGARQLAEYLCVRDVLTGPGGSLIIPTPDRDSREGDALKFACRAVERSSAENDVNRLASLAGLRTEGYSPYSVRRGHATQRSIDGQDFARIQRALRHKSASTSRGYVDKPDPQDNAERMMRGLSDEQ